jgi:hypothetical protein
MAKAGDKTLRRVVCRTCRHPLELVESTDAALTYEPCPKHPRETRVTAGPWMSAPAVTASVDASGGQVIIERALLSRGHGPYAA